MNFDTFSRFGNHIFCLLKPHSGILSIGGSKWNEWKWIITEKGMNARARFSSENEWKQPTRSWLDKLRDFLYQRRYSPSLLTTVDRCSTIAQPIAALLLAKRNKECSNTSGFSLKRGSDTLFTFWRILSRSTHIDNVPRKLIWEH